MAQPAYDLNYFASGNNQPKKKAPTVVVSKKKRSKQQKQIFKMIRTMLGVMLVVALVFGVLYTQASITELQNDIVKTEKQLMEEQALASYLNNEMESLSNMKHIEERALEIGLQKVDGNRITYIRVNEEEEIEVREKSWERLLDTAQNGLLSIWDYLNP